MSTGKSKVSTNSSFDSTTTSDPASWAKPNYTTGVNDAMSAYNSGKGGNVYQGARTPDALSGQTQYGQGLLQSTAQKFSGLSPVSEQNLSGIASGTGINPYFQQALNNTLGNVGNQVSNAASAQGIGSSGQQAQLATNLGRTASQALSDQYNKGIEQKIGANQAIDSQRQAYADTNAALAGQNVKAGLLNTALQQAQMNAAQQKFNDEEMAPWKRLGLLGAATNTFAGQYGTAHATGTGQSNTAAKQSASPFGAALGIGGNMLGGGGGGLLSAALGLL